MEVIQGRHCWRDLDTDSLSTGGCNETCKAAEDQENNLWVAVGQSGKVGWLKR